MNNKNREVLQKALLHLDEASRIIYSVTDKEQDSYDNIPENLQSSERAMRIEEVIDLLGDSTDSIDDAIGNIKSAIE